MSTLPISCTRHRCSRVLPNTSRSAARSERANATGSREPANGGAVADGLLRGTGQPAALEVEQQLAPALRALTVAVGEAQNLLAAPFVGPDQHQNALFFLGHARLEMDPVCPDIDDAPGIEVAALPVLILVTPRRLEPRDRGRGQTRRVGAKQRGKGFVKIPGRNALEIQPGQKLLHRFRLAQPGRRDGGGEPGLLRSRGAVAHPGSLHRHRANPRHQLALGQMTVPDKPRPAVLGLLARMGGEPRGQLRLHSPLDRTTRTGPQDLGQRVRRKSRWIGQLRDGSPRHVAYHFLFGELTASEHRHDMPPLSRHHQLSAISRPHHPPGCVRCSPSRAGIGSISEENTRGDPSRDSPDLSTAPATGRDSSAAECMLAASDGALWWLMQGRGRLVSAVLQVLHVYL